MSGVTIEEHPELRRDPNSGAVVCVDKSLINTRKERKRLRKEQTLKVDNLQSQVESLQNEIGEIKSLLTNLVEKYND